MNINEIEQSSENDEEFDEIRKCLRTGRWFEMKYKQYLTAKSEL
jgi:hypothetical protein